MPRWLSALSLSGMDSTPRRLASGGTLRLTYMRTGPRTSTPMVVVPGGPGLASAAPYRSFRSKADAKDIDVIMVEHRGVGRSRRDEEGRDLTGEDLTVRAVVGDLVEVLRVEEVSQAFFYGTSYGAYLVLAVAAAHPELVRGVILDSPVLDSSTPERAADELNRLYWTGTPDTATAADGVRALVGAGRFAPDELAFPLQFLHEFTGPETTGRLVALLEEGRGSGLLGRLQELATEEIGPLRRHIMEYDLVGEIVFRDLGYGNAEPSALGPLRPRLSLASASSGFSAFAGDPVDLRAALRRFEFPVRVLAGEWDVRTPRSVSEEIIALAEDGRLVEVSGLGHSVLDTAQPLALEAMKNVSAGRDLPDSMSARGSSLGKAMRMRLGLAERFASR